MKPAGPRADKLSDLEAKLLAAAVGGRLFGRPAEPVQLGRYRLQERIGQGGMGVVFRAHDPQLHRDVAIKLLHAARDGVARDQQARLRREALALGRLSHPNVVQVFEVGEADDHLFVAMELVRGVTLRAWLGERPRGLAETLAMVQQVGRGLAAAHAAGLVHRDLKPENVLVGADGRARVVDFGLARAAPGPEGATASSLERPLTASGMLLGTPAFMAPEQVRDPTRADARADQFSFCVLAHDALYGERPFAERGPDEAPTIRPPPAGSPVPPPLRTALLRGLRDEPADRWPTMDALLAAIDAAMLTTPAPTRRPWLLLAALATSLLIAIAALILATRPSRAPVLLAAITDLPAVHDTARAGQLAQLLADGRLADAAAIQTALLESPLDPRARTAIEALQARITAILAARTELALRFTGAASSPWTELDPSLVHADPARPGLVIDAPPDDHPLIAWSLNQASERVLVDLTITPRCLAPGARFTVRAVSSTNTRAELGLQVSAANDLELRCDTTATKLAALPADAAHPPLALQLDIDAGTIACRVLDEHGHPRLRSHAVLTGAWPAGPLRLELRGDVGSDPTCARIELTHVAITGASPGPHEPSPLARAGASLVDDDPHAAAQALAGLDEPRAALWQALALARLGRWQAGAPLLQRALADDATRRELQSWLRGDPRVLAPALKQMLGAPAYLELFAATWQPTRDPLSPALVRSILAGTGELMERCDAAVCAALLHTRGRALTQLHEPAAAMRAFDAALAVAPGDPAGRALASRILVDRSLLPGAGKTD